jgi:hypothetical protein
MRPVTVTAADLEAIAHDRYHHPVPLVQRRMEVVWLYHHGHTQADCAALAGVGHRSAQRYLDAYRDGGLAGFRRLDWKAPPANSTPTPPPWRTTSCRTRRAPPPRPATPSSGSPASAAASRRCASS